MKDKEISGNESLDSTDSKEDEETNSKKTVDKAIGRSRSRTRSRSRSRTRSRRKHSRRKRHSRSSSRSTSRSRSRSRSRSSRRHRRRHRSRSRHRSGKRGRSRSHSPMSNRRRHLGTRDNPRESRSLGAFGLSLYTTERDLKDVYETYGPLENVNVIYDHQTGRSRGFAFILFKNLEDAREARSQTNGIEIDGRRIRVDYSITERAHTPTPGVYMGRPTQPRRDSYRERGYYRSPSPYYRRSPSPYYRRSPSPYYSRGRHRRDYYSRERSFSPSRY